MVLRRYQHELQLHKPIPYARLALMNAVIPNTISPAVIDQNHHKFSMS
jgi:hypothetical protein